VPIARPSRGLSIALAFPRSGQREAPVSAISVSQNISAPTPAGNMGIWATKQRLTRSLLCHAECPPRVGAKQTRTWRSYSCSKQSGGTLSRTSLKDWWASNAPPIREPGFSRTSQLENPPVLSSQHTAGTGTAASTTIAPPALARPRRLVWRSRVASSARPAIHSSVMPCAVDCARSTPIQTNHLFHGTHTE